MRIEESNDLRAGRLPTLPGVDELLSLARSCGYVLPATAAEAIYDQSLERVVIEANRSGSHPDRSILVGALSLMLETIRSGGGSNQAAEAGISIARRFFELNPEDFATANAESIAPLDDHFLMRFAEIISQNDYNWSGLSIAFLDPEAAQRDRLRRNLELTPNERYERHRNLMRQINAARDVKA